MNDINSRSIVNRAKNPEECRYELDSFVSGFRNTRGGIMANRSTIKIVHTRDTLNLADRIGIRKGGMVMMIEGVPRMRVMAARTWRIVWIWIVGRASSGDREGDREGIELRIGTKVEFPILGVTETKMAGAVVEFSFGGSIWEGREG